MNVRIPEIPEYVGEVKGDRLYNAISIDHINFVCRDWRYSEVSHQIHPPTAWRSAYLDRRRDNVRKNQTMRQSLRDLKGKYKGRSLYVVLTGPSVFKNLRENPPRPDDIIVGINRGAVWCPYPLDFVLIADGVVDAPRLAGWREEARTLPIPAPEWTDPNRQTRLLMAQWADPGLRALYGEENVYYFRPSGLGHEASYTGLDLGLPELEYAFNTGSMTLHLGDLLGCHEIVLIGADMALTGGMFYVNQRAKVQPKTTYIVLADINGNLTVASNEMMVVCKKLETWAWLLKKYGVTCVNLTNEGIINRWFERKRVSLPLELPVAETPVLEPSVPMERSVPALVAA
ncbi:MAG: hypothetical protein HYT87_07745 [Nitrospirae bacterium]|nr:hypothetical protein [Nitrospirota bacterium]